MSELKTKIFSEGNEWPDDIDVVLVERLEGTYPEPTVPRIKLWYVDKQSYIFATSSDEEKTDAEPTVE